MSAESMKNKKRVVTLVTMVTAMFAISWLPIQLILLLKSIGMYKVTIFNISIQVSTNADKETSSNALASCFCPGAQ